MFWGILIGLVIGIVITAYSFAKLNVGTLVVYVPARDLDESPYLFTELNQSVNDICKKKSALFKVDIRPIDSQD